MNQQLDLRPAQTYEAQLVPALFQPHTEITMRVAALQPGERVLDVACGTGVVSRSAVEAVGPTGSVTGIDINPAMVAVAKPLAPGATFKQGSALELDVPDASFDCVLVQQGFQFFPDKAQAAREMVRVLVPRGRAVVACWQGPDAHPVMTGLFEGAARALGTEATALLAPLSLGDSGELRSILSEAGFASVEVTDHTLDVFFPSADGFVRLTVMAGMAVMPHLYEGRDPDQLVADTARETAGILDAHRDGDGLRFPMTTNIAVART